MHIRRIAWVVFCICGAVLLLFQCMDPVVSSDPDFGFILISGVSAMLLGSIVGTYLLLSYLVRWANKA
jgi:membrane-bound ClpP family serine protease